MANPTNRQELKDYCLRRLGFPVIDINTDDDQLEDRIDDALQMFHEFNYDGTEYTHLAYQVTDADRKNQYIRVADSIVGVSRVLPLSQLKASSTSSAGFNIFDINYQLRLNDFYNLTASSYTYYVIAREHLAMLDLVITGEVPMKFNKTTSRIYLDMNWFGKIDPGTYIVFEAWRIVDPDCYQKVFNDIWLKEYTTQLFKKQWGSNLTKYKDYVLPGGITVNGEEIYASAIAEIARLEDKIRDTYEAPPQMLVG